MEIKRDISCRQLLSPWASAVGGRILAVTNIFAIIFFS